MRVLVIEPSGNLWGSERALLDLLATMPVAAVAVCCPPGMLLNHELDKLHIRTLPYYVYGLHQASKWQRLTAATGVLRACLEFRPDVIYLNQSGSYKVVLPSAALLNLPIVAHIRIFEDAAYLARQRPSPLRLRGLIAISSAVESEILRFRELRNIRLHRVYDAYKLSPRGLQSAAPERVVNRLACIGRLVPVKGQDILVGALALLKHAGGGLECMIAGDGEPGFIQQLKQMASSADLDSEIQWLAFVDDVGAVLRTCSVLACPSHREPLGRVIFEAWDAGAVPVVFSGSGGAAEVVAAADGGILYDAQEPESLARALQRAVSLTREDAERLVRNGRAWMAGNCNPDTYGHVISSILSSTR